MKRLTQGIMFVTIVTIAASSPVLGMVEGVHEPVATQGTSVGAVSVSNAPNVYGMAIARAGGQSASNVLVIPAGEIKSENLLTITEDLSVMSFIIEKRFDESRVEQTPFRDLGLLLQGDGRTMRAVYLQGYGALFLAEMDIMLAPGPESQDPEKAQDDEKVDQTWRQARQELFEPGQCTVQIDVGNSPKYNAMEVENLKIKLTKSLRHAANIRNLKGDEVVIVSIVGSRRPQNTFVQYEMIRNVSTSSSNRGSSGYGGGFGGGAMGGAGLGGADGMRAKTMTIRVKKSDVDDFAGGKLDFEQFREKVTVLIY